MTDPTRFQFHDPSVPRAYERFLVPRVFAPFADVLLDAAELHLGDVVLDVATGPGTVARRAAERVGAAGRIVGVDIAAPMLEIARAKPSIADAAPIEYVASPAAPLAAPSAAFDRVLCQQGLQFFPDRAAALAEMRRVLKPGGRAAVAVWEGIARNELYAAFQAALGAVGASGLAELIEAPFSSPEGATLGEAMAAAGFTGVRVEAWSLQVVFEDGIEQAAAAFAGTPAEPSVALLDEETQRLFRDALRRAFEPLVSGGAVVCRMSTNIAVGHA